MLTIPGPILLWQAAAAKEAAKAAAARAAAKEAAAAKAAAARTPSERTVRRRDWGEWDKVVLDDSDDEADGGANRALAAHVS
jgi:hypothetical protein